MIIIVGWRIIFIQELTHWEATHAPVDDPNFVSKQAAWTKMRRHEIGRKMIESKQGRNWREGVESGFEENILNVYEKNYSEWQLVQGRNKREIKDFL